MSKLASSLADVVNLLDFGVGQLAGDLIACLLAGVLDFQPQALIGYRVEEHAVLGVSPQQPLPHVLFHEFRLAFEAGDVHDVIVHAAFHEEVASADGDAGDFAHLPQRNGQAFVKRLDDFGEGLCIAGIPISETKHGQDDGGNEALEGCSFHFFYV